MGVCAVLGCKSRSSRICSNSERRISFYSIPSIISNQCEKTKTLSEKRRNAWISSLSQNRSFRPGSIKSWTRVCDKHFISGKPAKLFDANNPDWIPTMNLIHEKFRVTVADPLNQLLQTITVENQELMEASVLIESTELSSTSRDNLRESSTNSSIIGISEMSVIPQSQLDSSVENISRGMATHKEQLTSSVDKECQTDFKMEDFINYENERRKHEEKQAEKFMDENYIKSDESRATYYTGLPSLTVIMAVFTLASKHLKSNSNYKLTLFQEFMIFILKIRLNLDLYDLGYRFCVGPSTISRIFDKWLDILYVRLNPLLRWLTKDELQHTMPSSFKEVYGSKVVVVIDCFEVFIERLSSLDARAETWSQHKHHNIVKFLIGIAPQGIVTFISLGWGGCTSDKHITEHSGILKNLLPGDLILADQDFFIEDNVSFYKAEVVAPSFTKGKKQLPAKEVMAETQNFANVQIHTKRVIGLLRNKYTILLSTLPMEYLQKLKDENVTKIDKITRICCCLV